jgi:hypothetical protein
MAGRRGRKTLARLRGFADEPPAITPLPAWRHRNNEMESGMTPGSLFPVYLTLAGRPASIGFLDW